MKGHYLDLAGSFDHRLTSSARLVIRFLVVWPLLAVDLQANWVHSALGWIGLPFPLEWTCQQIANLCWTELGRCGTAVSGASGCIEFYCLDILSTPLRRKNSWRTRRETEHLLGLCCDRLLTRGPSRYRPVAYHASLYRMQCRKN